MKIKKDPCKEVIDSFPITKCHTWNYDSLMEDVIYYATKRYMKDGGGKEQFKTYKKGFKSIKKLRKTGTNNWQIRFYRHRYRQYQGIKAAIRIIKKTDKYAVNNEKHTKAINFLFKHRGVMWS